MMRKERRDNDDDDAMERRERRERLVMTREDKGEQGCNIITIIMIDGDLNGHQSVVPQ